MRVPVTTVRAVPWAPICTSSIGISGTAAIAVAGDPITNAQLAASNNKL